jgi:polysaccharide export outer membrane protein
MENESRNAVRVSCACLGFLALILGTPGRVTAQANGPAAGISAVSTASLDEYKIGPGDVISVTNVDAPEFGGKFRISESGTMEIPGLPEAIQAEGQTPTELAHSIRQALIDAKQLRDPKVGVYVEEYHGRTITVLGAVAKPSVYPLERRTTVLEALSLAGGALPNSGNIVTIVRGAASAEASGNPVGSVEIIDLNRLVKGKDSSGNVQVQSGDVISVSSAEIIYVVGAVTKPGGFAMSDPSAGISVAQAIALAEGFTSVAATHRGLIIRQSTSDTARREIPVDIAQVLGGKSTDTRLAPNDILYVPQSGTKKTLKVMGDVAMAVVNGVAIYGVGYRIGTR